MPDLKLFDGYKIHILGALLILMGLLKGLTDIPEVEAIVIYGVNEPAEMLTTGWGIIGGRSLLNKFLNKKDE